ncbi:NADH-dependent dehydrogenase [Spirochaetia bacterium]|nr:NADH-dependent dehydrogenase [Spirochaetia bacterium]
MEKIRWGMIGCGDVTERKNGPGLYKCRDSELFGVTNRTITKAHDWVKRHGHGTVFSGVAELLACADIDIVYIATTPDTHKDLALRCAIAGKNCYLEKPIAPDYKDAEELQKAFASAGKKIFVAHYRRALPKTQKIQELLKKIVPVRSVQVLRSDTQKTIPGWRGNAALAGGGVFFETDVHLVDLLDFLFGPLHDWNVDAVNYSSSRPGEDSAALIAHGRDDILISGLWQYGAFKSQDYCEVMGDNGILTFPGMNTGSKARLETAAGIEEITLPEVEHVGMPLEQSIVDELLGRGTCPSTLESAMRTFQICCAAREALKKEKP